MTTQQPLLGAVSPAKGLVVSPESGAQRAPPQLRQQCKRFLLAALAALVLSSEFSGTALLVWFGQQPLEKFTPWLKSQETAGIAIFLGVWLGGSVACLPSTPLWLLGGFCFKQNFFLGLALNVVGCWLGSMVSFGAGACIVISRGAAPTSDCLSAERATESLSRIWPQDGWWGDDAAAKVQAQARAAKVLATRQGMGAAVAARSRTHSASYSLCSSATR
jgi:hypothetical protein